MNGLATRPEIPDNCRAYLDELAADIAKHGPSGDLDTDIEQAHARRQAFAIEMNAGKTLRARQARKIICSAVFANAQIRSSLASCERMQEDEGRAEWLASVHGEVTA